MKNFKVCGLREELYIGKEVSGHNCDFDYNDAEMTRHVVLLKDTGTDGLFELTLQVDQGESYSGWCIASHGSSSLKEVSEFAGKTHLYLGGDISLTDPSHEYWSEDVITEAFSFSPDGGDRYYPSGGYEINFDMFKLIGDLVFNSRPVHIFYGDSNSCKSHIAALTGKTVYETDLVACLEEVPDQLTSDIIVIGNRWPCSVDDITNKLFGMNSNNPPSIITVEFSKC